MYVCLCVWEGERGFHPLSLNQHPLDWLVERQKVSNKHRIARANEEEVCLGLTAVLCCGRVALYCSYVELCCACVGLQLRRIVM